MENVRIFTATYHREAATRASLALLLSTCRSRRYEVSVSIADNNSPGSLREFLAGLAEKSSRVTVDLLEKNIGKAEAINRMARKYNDFDWFISFDSDLLCPEGRDWVAELVESFKQVASVLRAGMVATGYIDNGNNPQPEQPRKTGITVLGRQYDFHYGGPVAGGCFVTSRDIWRKNEYTARGTYGGVDGRFVYSLLKKRKVCGYVAQIKMEHPLEADQEYQKWKCRVIENLHAYGLKAKPERIGNDRGFFDR